MIVDSTEAQAHIRILHDCREGDDCPRVKEREQRKQAREKAARRRLGQRRQRLLDEGYDPDEIEATAPEVPAAAATAEDEPSQSQPTSPTRGRARSARSAR